ncbi:MAG: porin family protein, partial [Desulfosalsimonadaceae bacterium]|nr:porin family protein [Desulfosalsimonadaceae bacterium]
MMKKRIVLSALLISGLLCFAQAGWCETSQGDFYISPMFGGHVFEGNQHIDNGPTYGLGLGYQFTDNLGVEAMFNYTRTDSDPGSLDIDVFPMHLDAVYNFMPDQKLVPYVAAGLGAIVFDPDGDCEDTDFMMNYG